MAITKHRMVLAEIMTVASDGERVDLGPGEVGLKSSTVMMDALLF